MTVRLFLPTDLTLADVDETVRRAKVVLASVADPRAVAFGVRDHDAPTRTRVALARALIALGRPVAARVLIFDRIDLALAVDADGVHLAERSVDTADARVLLGDRFLGRSCHDEAGIAAAGDVDAITLSPLFASPGKGEPLGVSRFAALVALSTRPVIALGGIDASNAATALALASGIATIRAWLHDDPALLARAV